MNSNKISIKVTTAEAADILGVSTATISNWVKAGLLRKDLDDKKLFKTNNVINLKTKIESGEIQRLNLRANKKNSSNQFLPFESVNNKDDLSKIIRIIDEVKKFDLNIEETLFVLAINLLMKQGIISENIIQNSFYFNNDNFRDEIRNWISVLNPDNIFKELVYNIDIGEFTEDILGIFYQYFLLEGEKNKKGSYYTPDTTVKEIVNESLKRVDFNSTAADKKKDNIKILDPCCGTGKFLLGFSDYLIEKKRNEKDFDFDPQIIWGFDNDKIAVRIARLNLMLKFKNQNKFSPNIFHLDYLIDKFNFTRRVRFNAIISNPPWGVKLDKDEKIILSNKFPNIKTKESFSLFLIKSLQMLKEDGYLSYLLPESVLNIKTHKDIRKYILDNSDILTIKKYGKLFKGVFTNVINLEIKKNELMTKNESNKDSQVELVDIKKNRHTKLSQNRFIRNSDYIFDTNLSPSDEVILSKIYSQRHKTLKNNAKWALGIVTGNNSKYVYSSVRKSSYKRVVIGKEINKFYIYDNKQSYIDTNEIETFQQVANFDFYRVKEKLLYKFISGNLVFAYDNNALLTLNSANVLIPKISKISLKIVLALLNSSLYQYLFKKKFNAIKVLKGDLEKLPFPSWNKEKQKQIEKLVNILIQKNIFDEYRKEIFKELDSLIFKNFRLTKKEIKIITNYDF